MDSVFFKVKHNMVSNTSAIDKAFRELKEGDYEMKLIRRNKRSLNQNAFFHAIMPDIQQGLYEAGFHEVKSAEDAKTVVKNLFLKKKITNELTGDEIIIIRDTSDLTKEEMMVFIDEVIRWAAEYLGITIYSPSEQSAFSYAHDRHSA